MSATTKPPERGRACLELRAERQNRGTYRGREREPRWSERIEVCIQNGKDMLMPRLNSRGCCRRDLSWLPHAPRNMNTGTGTLGARTEPSRAFRLGWFDGFLQPTRCSHNGAPMPRTGNRGRLVCVANSPLAAQASASSCSAVQCSVGWARVGVGVGCAVAGCQVGSANNDHLPPPCPSRFPTACPEQRETSADH